MPPDETDVIERANVECRSCRWWEPQPIDRVGRGSCTAPPLDERFPGLLYGHQRARTQWYEGDECIVYEAAKEVGSAGGGKMIGSYRSNIDDEMVSAAPTATAGEGSEG